MFVCKQAIFFQKNSIFMYYTALQLQHYVQNLFTTNRAAVIGVGVDHGDLLCFAQNLALESGAGPGESAAKYSGGDVRQDTAESLAHVAVAVEGAR
jgi:ubiquinol-cytochrome c reductase core subunit 2